MPKFSFAASSCDIFLIHHLQAKHGHEVGLDQPNTIADIHDFIQTMASVAQQTPSFVSQRLLNIWQDPMQLRLFRGVNFETKAANGQMHHLKLRARWLRDAPYLTLKPQSIDELTRPFSTYIQDNYSQDQRFQLTDEFLAWVGHEDTNFAEHVAWITLEDSQGLILASLKLYYFDYEARYDRHQGLSSEKQMFLPLERLTHYRNYRHHRYMQLFSSPIWQIDTHRQLVLELVENSHLEPRRRDIGPHDHIESPTPRLNQEQIKKAIDLHRQLQKSELSRPTRANTPTAKGINVTDPLFFGAYQLGLSAGIEVYALVAPTEVHRRYYRDLGAVEVQAIPLDSEGEREYLFHLSREQLRAATEFSN